MVQSVATQTPDPAKREDRFVELVGHFGKWQMIIFISVSIVELSSGWVQMAIIFLTPNLTFWCSSFENDSGIGENNTCHAECLEYSYDANTFDNTIVSEWDLVCDRRWLASFTQTILQLGILVGSIIFGFLSDRYGRKNTFLISVIGVIALGFGVPFSPNYTVFTILRFFLGVFTAGTMVISFVIVMEVTGKKYREVVCCLFQIPFMIGHMTVALFAYFFRSWDSYYLALAVPPLIYLVYFFILTESPRWLVSVGKLDEATKIVKKAAIMNQLPTEKIEDTIKKIAHETSASDAPKENYSALFRRSLRLKTIVCCALWLITGVTFYGFNQYISQTSPDPFVSVVAAGAIQIPSNILSIWLIRIFGRRNTTTVFFILGGVCAIALAFVPDVFWITLTIGTLGVSCAAVVASTIYIHTSELYPTVVRNMAVGACSTSMRVGSMIAPFISDSSETVVWLPTLIFSVVPICGGLLCLLLPETKDMSLLDSMEDVECDCK